MRVETFFTRAFQRKRQKINFDFLFIFIFIFFLRSLTNRTQACKAHAHAKLTKTHTLTKMVLLKVSTNIVSSTLNALTVRSRPTQKDVERFLKGSVRELYERTFGRTFFY